MCGADALTVEGFFYVLKKRYSFEVVYEEHPKEDGHYFHFLSVGAIPEGDVDLACRVSGVREWSYYVLH
jgi:hypothetical protein